MVRTELMRRLQGFDPRFFLYWEEMDLCLRAEALGAEVWAVGAAVANHVGGASSVADETRIGGCIAVHYYQSRYYYMRKHHGRVAAAMAELGEYLLIGLRTLIDAVRGNGIARFRPRLQARLLSQPKLV
jgi:GT2 family glycosyltransferase